MSVWPVNFILIRAEARSFFPVGNSPIQNKVGGDSNGCEINSQASFLSIPSSAIYFTEYFCCSRIIFLQLWKALFTFHEALYLYGTGSHAALSYRQSKCFLRYSLVSWILWDQISQCWVPREGWEFSLMQHRHPARGSPSLWQIHCHPK